MKKQKIMVQNITCIIPESSKAGGLFLGNIYGAQNPTILKEYGIRAVLTLSTQTPLKYDENTDVPFHLKIQAHDKDDYDIIRNDFETCKVFIEEKIKYTNVLVHCYAGVSRSVTIVVAYLMTKYGWSLNKALSFVKFKRCVAKPNKGFQQQLTMFEAQLLKKSPISNANQNSIPSSKLRKATTLVQTSSQKGLKEVYGSKENLKFNQMVLKRTTHQSKPSSVYNTAQQHPFFKTTINHNEIRNNSNILALNMRSTSTFNSARERNQNLINNVGNTAIRHNKISFVNQNRNHIVLGNSNL